MSMKRSRTSSARPKAGGESRDSWSKPKDAQHEPTWEETVGDKPDDAFRPFSLAERYAVGDLIFHAKFGRGAVVAADATQIEVLLAEGRKKLAHGRS